MLGVREQEIYGSHTLNDIRNLCASEAEKRGVEVDFRQSNAEEEIVGWIQDARTTHSGIIINAAAYTHSSIAIMDALLAVGLPVVEVHLSNIFKREDFRHKSYISPASVGIICGFGATGYKLALQAITDVV